VSDEKRQNKQVNCQKTPDLASFGSFKTGTGSFKTRGYIKGDCEMNLCYASLKLLLKTYRIILPQDCRIYNADCIPSGAKIIAANHPNVTDTFHLAMEFKDPLHTLIMGDLFSIPVFGWMLAASGQIPVYPEQKEIALQKACQILATGGMVLIYPEARLNPENRKLKGKAGAIRMSLTCGAPIIPLGIYVPDSCTRSLRVQSGGRMRQGRWQTKGQCYLYYGDPWVPSDEIRASRDDASIYKLTDQLMENIYSLSQKAVQAWLQDEPAQQVLYDRQNTLIDRKDNKIREKVLDF
jgi:1-acyl-sn-glycerol-3-phosphate acyltransferase